jgi:GNAT superfamily N-acetyltransferase
MGDLPAAMALVHQAGWNQTAADWDYFLRTQPDGCFAACVGDQLVGTVTTIVYDRRLAWLGMMLVDAGHRGLGYGQQLLACALDFLDRSAVRCVKLDATPEGRRLYRKHGFVDEQPLERWALPRPESDRHPQAIDQRRPATSRDSRVPNIEDIFALDRELFGADRHDLLRRVAADAPDLVLVRSNLATTAGYAFGRRGTRADHLGPWVARDERTADWLLASFLERSDRPLVFVDCVGGHAWAGRLVRTRGFGVSRLLTRMYRGIHVAQDPSQLMGGILGFEFG